MGDMIGIGLMVGMIILASAFAKLVLHKAGLPTNKYAAIKAAYEKPNAGTSAVSSADKQRALDAYKALVKDKLDVIKTAIAMGYDERELKALDERLEKLIGKEQLARIAEGQPLSVSAELHSTNLEVERMKLQEMRQQAGSSR